MLLNEYTQEQLIHEVLVAPRAGLLPLSDTRIVERPGFWQLITPSLKQGGMNEVICTEMPSDAVIDETLLQYREQGVLFRWTIPPSEFSEALGEKLAARGMKRQEALGMARKTDADPMPLAPEISVEEVDLANVDEFTRVMAEGWGGDPAPLAALYRRSLTQPVQRHHHFIAKKDGVAGCVGTYIELDQSAYLIGAVTLPNLRGGGLYRALVDARLRHAASRGQRLVTTLARAGTSAPILKRLGFVVAFSTAIFMDD